MKSGVYKIENLIDGKCYIGSAVDINKRWQQHKIALKENRHHSAHLQRAWGKYKEPNFHFSVLLLCSPYELLIREQESIDANRSDYNMQRFARSNRGHKASLEARMKQSIAKLGKKRGPHTIETRMKIANSNRGKRLSIERKLKLSATRKGVPLSESTKIKMSQSRMGRKVSQETREKIRIANTGRKLPAHLIEKIRASKLGRKASDATRAKMSSAQKGKVFTPEHKLALSAAAKRRCYRQINACASSHKVD